MKGCFLKAAVAWYKRLGIQIERVMTDDRSCYQSKVFNKLLYNMNICHVYTLKTNGKAERFIPSSPGLGHMPKPMTPRSNGRKSCPKGCIITIGRGLMPG
jgi:hypothetical protein